MDWAEFGAAIAKSGGIWSFYGAFFLCYGRSNSGESSEISLFSLLGGRYVPAAWILAKAVWNNLW
jgi:hypothetical protein